MPAESEDIGAVTVEEEEEQELRPSFAVEAAWRPSARSRDPSN